MIVVVTVFFGALAPSPVEADGSETEAAGPKPPAADVEAASTIEGPEPEHVELSLGVAPTLGGLIGGLGGLSGMSQWPALFPVAVDIALPLGSRALLSVGGALGYASGDTSYALSIRVPVSFLFYLDAPRAGAFVPSVRVLARGAYQESTGLGFATVAVLGLGSGVRGGLTYFFAEEIAFRAELGAGVDATFGPAFTNVAIDLESALTLVLRV